MKKKMKNTENQYETRKIKHEKPIKKYFSL
jgi:hypothetical protein